MNNIKHLSQLLSRENHLTIVIGSGFNSYAIGNKPSILASWLSFCIKRASIGVNNGRLFISCGQNVKAENSTNPIGLSVYFPFIFLMTNNGKS
jgi:hypothetical protein